MADQKKNDLAAFYDDLYAQNGAVFGGGEPAVVVQKATEIVSTGKALDVGAGQGRNAIFLAQQGFDVTAVDVSSVAVEQIQSAAKKENLSIETKVGGVSDLGVADEEYDIILFMFILHHLEDSEARKIIEQYKRKSKKGSIHVIATFTSQGDFYALPKSKNMFYPDPGELKELYKDWEIEEYTEKEGRANATHPDGTHMKNLTAHLLAQKADRSRDCSPRTLLKNPD